MDEEFLPTTPATRIEVDLNGVWWAVDPETGEKTRLSSHDDEGAPFVTPSVEPNYAASWEEDYPDHEWPPGIHDD